MGYRFMALLRRYYVCASVAHRWEEQGGDVLEDGSNRENRGARGMVFVIGERV